MTLARHAPISFTDYISAKAAGMVAVVKPLPTVANYVLTRRKFDPATGAELTPDTWNLNAQTIADAQAAANAAIASSNDLLTQLAAVQADITALG